MVQSNQNSLPVAPIPKPTYADVVTNKETPHGGYVTSKLTVESGRLQRKRRPIQYVMEIMLLTDFVLWKLCYLLIIVLRKLLLTDFCEDTKH